MNWNIAPQGKLWILRRPKGHGGVSQFTLRREALSAARTCARKTDVIVVRNASGMVVIREVC